MKVALLQLKTLPTPEENLEKIKQMLVQAKQEGADLAVLPEMCCCPYENSAFVRYAMPENAPFLQGIAEMQGLSACMWLQALFRLRRMAESITPPSSMIIREAASQDTAKPICLISMSPADSISWNPIPLPPAGMSPPSTPLGEN